jgi:hypothetical protein
MMNRIKSFRFWLSIACVVQILTGVIHSASFFVESQPANETEKQLLDLFENYKQDLGAGYSRSTAELFTAVSACFALLYVFGGLLNWYLLRKRASRDLISGLLLIQVLVYGVAFVVMLNFAFLPPIILTGLVFLLLLTSKVADTIQKQID